MSVASLSNDLKYAYYNTNHNIKSIQNIKMLFKKKNQIVTIICVWIMIHFVVIFII